VYLLAACLSLYIFSNNFDETEMKALAAIVASLAASETVRAIITRAGKLQ
jgi:hypothetical protein